MNSVEIKNRISNIKILGEFTNNKEKFEEIHFSNGSWYNINENKKETFGIWKIIGNSICYTYENKDSINSCVYIYTKKNNQKNIYFVDNKKERIFAKSTSFSKDIKIDKLDEKNESDNKKLIILPSSELSKIEYSLKWSEHFTDILIINLTNKTNYTIKELEFWFINKKCSDFDTNSKNWPNKTHGIFFVNFQPNQKLTVRKEDLSSSKYWCYTLNKAKGYLFTL